MFIVNMGKQQKTKKELNGLKEPDALNKIKDVNIFIYPNDWKSKDEVQQLKHKIVIKKY